MSVSAVKSPGIHSAITLNTAFTLIGLALVVRMSDSASVLLVTAGMMLLILVSSLFARYRLRSEAEIERCLSRLAETDEISAESIPQIVGNGQSVRGWNRLIESAVVQQLLERADHALTDDGAFQKSSELPDVVLDSLSDGIAVSDESGSIVYQNPAFGSLLECAGTDNAVSQLLIHELFREFENFTDYAVSLAFPDQAAMLTIELYRGTQTADGVIRVNRRAIRNHAGLYVWTIRDITQQQLAIETRDSFVSAATHELRTPLSNIRAYAETLTGVGEINVEDQHRFLNIIMSEAGRLDRIIDDLLNISHMQAGSMTLDRHECQIERLVKEVQDTIRPLFESKNLTFETRIPPRLPELIVDKDKLEAALVNLLGNAIKYTADGGRVVLEAENASGEVRFHVEDSGIGISTDELPRIFDRFFRSNDSRVHQISGTGLGLAFAQDVARLHGGRIDVTSELNHGSRFTLTIPARAMDIVGEQAVRQLSNPPAHRRTESVEVRKDRAPVHKEILVVSSDDSPGV
ncbi:MAG: ATP-binding protein [Planctomycetaceae bacterium]|nr:ATP-binding protein [Planctomycetaceae bacterium]